MLVFRLSNRLSDRSDPIESDIELSHFAPTQSETGLGFPGFQPRGK
jgi:hypothetical protein